LHVADACATAVVHAWPHAPQLLTSLVVFEHVEPHSVVAPEHAGTHAAPPLARSQIGVAPEQAVVHEPQWAACERLASQPSFGSPLQSAKPGAHEDAGKAHWPPAHVVGPATLGRLVQSCPHEPQVAGFERSVLHPAPPAPPLPVPASPPVQSAKPGAHWYEQRPALHPALPEATFERCVQSFPHAPQLRTSPGDTHAPPHVSSSAAHAQAPHWHCSVHVWAPPEPQLWVAPGAQAPAPVHADLQTPLWHARDCVPHGPHGCVIGPVHIATPTGPVIIGGSGDGVGTDDDGPQTAIPSCSV
jgi:hypothetical protein